MSLSDSIYDIASELEGELERYSKPPWDYDKERVELVRKYVIELRCLANWVMLGPADGWAGKGPEPTISTFEECMRLWKEKNEG